MGIKRTEFGTTKKGETAFLYQLENQNGMRVCISNFGATIVKILLPDAQGDLTDVVLGFPTLNGYEENTISMGAVVGRVANRIENGSFTLNGMSYQLEQNDGNNCLHGGRDFYPKRIFTADTISDEEGEHLVLTLESPDGDQGFPGKLDLTVKYSLLQNNSLRITYYAVSDADTILNITNHSYFNIAGEGSGRVDDQLVTIYADAYTKSDEYGVPHGEYVSVEGTPMDFRTPKAVGKDLHADYQPLIWAKGYDHNYVLRKEDKSVALAASVEDPKSGRKMNVYTDLPGMQFYTANFTDEIAGKCGRQYEPQEAVCFETQFYPNAIRVPEFPQPILRKDTVFKSTTIYEFK